MEDDRTHHTVVRDTAGASTALASRVGAGALTCGLAEGLLAGL
jgi:hypothetical protein